MNTGSVTIALFYQKQEEKENKKLHCILKAYAITQRQMNAFVYSVHTFLNVGLFLFPCVCAI